MGLPTQEQIDAAIDAAKPTAVFAPPNLFIGLTLKEGETVIIDRIEEGHSWTRNGWNILFSQMAYAFNSSDQNTFEAGVLSARDTSGTIRGDDNRTAATDSNSAPGHGFLNYSVGSDFGIQVGSGNTAFSAADYTLDTLIDHSTNGATDGTLEYAAMPYIDRGASYNPTTNVWTQAFTRVFSNNNAESPVVREVGLVWRGNAFYHNERNYLCARDVLASSITVAPSQVLTVQYILTMDFTTIDGE
jgi:hypothetical protein